LVRRPAGPAGKFQGCGALTRNPDNHHETSPTRAVQSRPGTARKRSQRHSKGAYGVFSGQPISGKQAPAKSRQATAAIHARPKGCRCVTHFVWSNAWPDVKPRSSGREVSTFPHLLNRQGPGLIAARGRSRVPRITRSFIPRAPGYLPELRGHARRASAAGRIGGLGRFRSIPKCAGLHMGDVRELGNIVAGAFAQPGRGGAMASILPLVGDLLSFNEIIEILNRQGGTTSHTSGFSKESFRGVSFSRGSRNC